MNNALKAAWTPHAVMAYLETANPFRLLPHMADGRVLQIYRDGRRMVPRVSRLQLPTGAEANYITLAHAAKIIREDQKFDDLGNFVFREIIGLDNTDVDSQIQAAFEFCRDKIIYRQEDDGFETVADLWSCLYALDRRYPVGDCVLKSTVLATSLGFLKLKPFFYVVRLTPGVEWFDHVYVGLDDGNGGYTALDPTPENSIIGEQVRSYEKLRVRIF